MLSPLPPHSHSTNNKSTSTIVLKQENRGKCRAIEGSDIFANDDGEMRTDNESDLALLTEVAVRAAERTIDKYLDKISGKDDNEHPAATVTAQAVVKLPEPQKTTDKVSSQQPTVVAAATALAAGQKSPSIQQWNDEATEICRELELTLHLIQQFDEKRAFRLPDLRPSMMSKSPHPPECTNVWQQADLAMTVAAEFESLDRNGDGVVDAEEWAKAHGIVIAAELEEPIIEVIESLKCDQRALASLQGQLLSLPRKSPERKELHKKMEALEISITAKRKASLYDEV